MSLRDKIVELIAESGVGYVEKSRTIHTTCPSCGRDDKFSILKENGSCICYRGTCSFGKQWFDNWVALTYGISIRDAKDKIQDRFYQKKEVLDLNLGWKIPTTSHEDLEMEPDSREWLLSGIESIAFPEFHMVPISHMDAEEGVTYLDNRGINAELASKYDICYSKTFRRIYLPIYMNGTVYGYQGRHIDPVEDGLRIRNNIGFHRETLVMFADNLVNKSYAILAEGPFDALKFDLVGGNISTMGKVVTEKQMEIIKSYGISDLYLALDDDAANEMNEIVNKYACQFNLFKVNLPQSCVDRCTLTGKKPDFGECSMDEASVAFKTAQPIGLGQILNYVK